MAPELLDDVESFIKENVQLGYTTKEEFVQDAVRLGLTSLSEEKSPGQPKRSK